MRLFDFEDDVQREVSEISDISERIKARNHLIANRLEADVQRAGWKRLSKGDALSLYEHASLFVIGVVNWDHKSLQFLGDLAVQETRHAIYVFDLDDVHSLDELANVMPGVHLPTQTPIGAEYIDGRLRHVAEGSRVLDLIRSLE